MPRSKASGDGIDSDFLYDSCHGSNFRIFCFNELFVLQWNFRNEGHFRECQGFRTRLWVCLFTMMIIDRDFFKRGYGNKNLHNKIIGELDSLCDKVKAPWHCIGAGLELESYQSFFRSKSHHYSKTMTFEASLGPWKKNGVDSQSWIHSWMSEHAHWRS